MPRVTSVTPWRDGVLVCAAPDILLARDTDGDGRADQTEVLFTGFATHNFQARVNSLEYGLDGWVEGSCGLFGGDITSTRDGRVTHLGARDFRIDPDGVPWFLEAGPYCSFAPSSVIVKMAAAHGYSLPALFDTLCREARIEAA